MSASITVLPGLGDGTFATEILSSIDCFCTFYVNNYRQWRC